jgi:putative transposase
LILSDAGFGELRRMLEYKAGWYGATIAVADRRFPSSKMCSGRGHVHAGLKLSDRGHQCTACGLVLDRDVNAAINLARYALAPEESPPLPAAA